MVIMKTRVFDVDCQVCPHHVHGPKTCVRKRSSLHRRLGGEHLDHFKFCSRILVTTFVPAMPIWRLQKIMSVLNFSSWWCCPHCNLGDVDVDVLGGWLGGGEEGEGEAGDGGTEENDGEHSQGKLMVVVMQVMVVVIVIVMVMVLVIVIIMVKWNTWPILITISYILIFTCNRWQIFPVGKGQGCQVSGTRDLHPRTGCLRINSQWKQLFSFISGNFFFSLVSFYWEICIYFHWFAYKILITRNLPPLKLINSVYWTRYKLETSTQFLRY